ncbi:cyclic nucleotide-binding domain-containing protein, partial [Cribrihabitans sp. XS_ASV171]
QMTPFLFYSVGGYLVIQGQVTVGALVAALAAYKDLSSPWKELLDYYNQVQDMSLRWQIVTERFAPRNMIPEELFEGEPSEIPRLNGPIELKNVTVRDHEGNTVLEDISLSIPPGARVAIQSNRAAERTALAELLTREVLPARGKVILSGHDLNSLHQSVIAARIGYAHSRPYLFDGTLGDNLLMPLRTRPQPDPLAPAQPGDRVQEAIRAGNSPDSLDADWIDPGLAGLTDGEQIRDWWFRLVEAMGIDEFMFRRTLRSRFDSLLHPRLAREIVALRPKVAERIRAAGLDDAVFRFDPDSFNPAVPLGGNLLYAAPSQEVSPESLAQDTRFLEMLREQDLAEEGVTMALGVIQTLRQTFGREDTDHPLFLRLGMEEEMYHRLLDIADRRAAKGEASLSDEECALLLTVPFLLTAEQIGSGFPEEYKDKILAIRRTQAKALRESMSGTFDAVSPDRYLPRLTVIENALFGRVSMMAGAKAEAIEDVVAEVLIEAGLRRRVASIIYDLPSGLGGTNLPTVFQERAAFSRAGIKRPDILVLDRALASHDSQSRLRTRQKLRELLPNSIMIFMEDRFEHPGNYDIFVEIRDGRIDGVQRSPQDLAEPGAAADLARKQRIIAETDLFSGLDARNQRLLAFSAQWYDVAAGQVIFSQGQPADAAYLCLEGHALLRWAEDRESRRPVTHITPGRLIGDLSIITRTPRQMDLIAVENSRFLRIGAEEFRAVIDSDPHVASRLLEAVARHLVSAAGALRGTKVSLADIAGSEAPGLPPEMMHRHYEGGADA